MSWGTAVQAVLDTLEADGLLQSYMGGAFRIRNAGELEDVQIPSVVYAISANVEEEVFEPITVSLGIWTRDTNEPAIVQNHRIQSRLRKILHRETYHTDFGPYLSSRFTGGSQGDDPETGVVRWDLDFELRPLRSKYPLVPQSS